jgi:uncharacterized protein YajQ (UPF0234 family)
MPSFDVVSEVDKHELANAVDQANREIGPRYDFKGVDATFELKDDVITLKADNDPQLRQMLDVLRTRLAARKIDVSCLKVEPAEVLGQRATQKVSVIQGIESEIARKIVKHVKDLKMKVQIAIQGEKLRVTGAKRDDLQKVIAVLRAGEFGVPLQYDNFRD